MGKFFLTDLATQSGKLKSYTAKLLFHQSPTILWSLLNRREWWGLLYPRAKVIPLTSCRDTDMRTKCMTHTAFAEFVLRSATHTLLYDNSWCKHACQFCDNHTIGKVNTQWLDSVITDDKSRQARWPHIYINCVVTVLLPAVNNSVYTVTVQSLYSHCAY